MTTRSIVAVLVGGFASYAIAAGAPCERIEYAQLKDASRSELRDEYCRAMRRAALNRDLFASSRSAFNERLKLGAPAAGAQRDMSAYGAAEVSCVGVAESVAAMLRKKFKSPEPSCD